MLRFGFFDQNKPFFKMETELYKLFELILLFASINIPLYSCKLSDHFHNYLHLFKKQNKTMNMPLDCTDSGYIFLSSGRGLDAAPECFRDDEVVDITERLPIGHCKPQRRSGDTHTGAFPAHV